MSGALSGLDVIELGGIGPLPFAGMLLADMGANVIRIDSPKAAAANPERYQDGLTRGKKSVLIDLHHPVSQRVLRGLADRSDVLMEGFRPGALERLGLDPEKCLVRNPRLIIGRMTGWGQTGSLAAEVGHDLNYIGVAGALYPLGPASQPPPVPLNLVGDYGGGGMLLVVGVLAALHARTSTGRGQVIDAAMVDGAVLLMTKWFGELAGGRWSQHRGRNHIDGAAPFYRVYATKDGSYLAVAALEPKFYAALLAGLDLSTDDTPAQWDRSSWKSVSEQMERLFLTKTRPEWELIFAPLDACVSPVLPMAEAITHEHHQARGTFVELGNLVLPAPAPRFSRTPSTARPLPLPGEHTASVLRELGLDDQEIASVGLCRPSRDA